MNVNKEQRVINKRLTDLKKIIVENNIEHQYCDAYIRTREKKFLNNKNPFNCLMKSANGIDFWENIVSNYCYYYFNAFCDVRVQAEKFQKMYQLSDSWLVKELTLKDFTIHKLNEKKYTSIIIYGVGKYGKLLFHSLQDASINVVGFMDKREDLDLVEGIKVYTPFQKIPEVDIIVITPVLFYDSILEELQRLGIENTISLTDLICN